MNTATPSKPPRASGFWWALAGFGLGSLVSVGFNLQSAWLHSDTPSLASQAAAIVWPLTLIVSVEVLSRVAWPKGWGWSLVRTSGILAVALGSATISYGHIYEVLIAWGYDKHQAIVGPLVVDGLMLISGFALVSLGHAARAAQAASQDASAQPSRTPDVPARPDPSSGQEHASSVTPIPPSPVTEEAPQEAPATPAAGASQEGHTGLRLVPSRRLPARTRTASRKPSRADVPTDQEVLSAIADYERQKGDLPTANKLKTTLRIGAGRAKDLLEQYSNDKQEVTA